MLKDSSVGEDDLSAAGETLSPAIEFCDVSGGYGVGPGGSGGAGGGDVVNSVSGAIPAGRVCALIGPNAAGKTTLMRLALGHLATSAGEVRVGGQAVGAMSARQRAEVMSYVPQRGEAAFGFTVEAVVAMGRFALPAKPQAVHDAMVRCAVIDLASRVFTALSVGQQQRVLLARAIAQSAGGGLVMLLDEPGSAMDMRHSHAMMRLLGELAAKGMSVLAVLHDLNLAARYSDDVWLLDQGRLVASGPWHEVLRPSVLEPVYQVRLRPLMDEGSARPVFHVQPI